jgi:hypothetical protein
LRDVQVAKAGSPSGIESGEVTRHNDHPVHSRIPLRTVARGLCQKANDTARPFTREANNGTIISLAGEAA